MKRITDETRLSATHVEASPRVIDRGIDVRGVAWTVIGIVGLVVAAALGMWWLLSSFLSAADAADPRPAPAVAAVPRELPPGPRLQASPEAEMARMRAREELILGSYGRTADGRVRIPIERAIEALAARGETPAAGATGTAAAAAPGGPTDGAAGAAGAPGGPAPAAPPAASGAGQAGGAGKGAAGNAPAGGRSDADGGEGE